jgi:hypothetical protein
MFWSICGTFHRRRTSPPCSTSGPGVMARLVAEESPLKCQRGWALQRDQLRHRILFTTGYAPGLQTSLPMPAPGLPAQPPNLLTAPSCASTFPDLMGNSLVLHRDLRLTLFAIIPMSIEYGYITQLSRAFQPDSAGPMRNRLNLLYIKIIL